VHTALPHAAGAPQTNAELQARVRQLEAELERYRAVAHSSTDVVSTTDNNGVFTWVADSVTNVLGWLPEEMVGRPLRDFIDPDHYPLLAAELPALQRGETPRAELRMHRKDGGWRWISFMRQQIFDANGLPLYRVGRWRDIAEDRSVRDALTASHELMRATLDSMLDPHVVLEAVRDASGRIVNFSFTEANQAAAAFHETTREALLGSLFVTHHPTAGTTSLLADCIAVVESDECLVLDDYAYPLDLLEGEMRRFDIRGVKMRDGLSLTWRDVTDRYQAAQHLQRLAHHDGLTGALNHGEALRRLGAALQDERNPGEYVAVLFCDTDLFKHINDTHGHAAGDHVLVALTQRITDCVRRQDLVARMGGDEFLVVLSDVHSIEEALSIADKIRIAAAEPIVLAEQELQTTLSIGVALASRDEHLDRLLKRADIAMYTAKRSGRDRVQTL